MNDSRRFPWLASEAEHTELRDRLLGRPARAILSGCPNALQRRALSGWNRLAILSATTQSGPDIPRLKVAWSNRAITGASLFEVIAHAQAAEVCSR
ncbi:hypothetical protein [Mycobacterium paragordonae]|uniref:hypothetical protein n=1 Tax=Mycobacterium paragordonae TaxID=1389713 RepID=UPI00105F11A1|nr:hypothetical protein [Mycobacterium paragordonae]TDL02944.1 hypothetical protein EUA05_25975 [Mycobacterium paragordonae]